MLKEFAKKMFHEALKNNSEENIRYGEELTSELEQEAKEKGIVVVFGASDDLMELRGAIYDEVGCYDGGIGYFNEKGVVKNKCVDKDCPNFHKQLDNLKTIEAVWIENDGDFNWIYETEIPHETFEVYDTD